MNKIIKCTFNILILLALLTACAAQTQSQNSETPTTETSFSTAAPTRIPQTIAATTLKGKVIFGYQGWFSCPGDGAGLNWFHWFQGHLGPSPENLTVDMWPDISEYPPSALCDTGMKLPNGEPFMAFSSFKQETVLKHFEWMEAYGIDGVEVQRFTPLPHDNQDFRNFVDQVLLNARAGAETYGRVFYIQFAGAEAGMYERFTEDWRYIVDELEITQSPQYLHHDGLPVVGIFIPPVTEYGPEEVLELLHFFQENEDPKYRATVKAGVVMRWFEADDEWAEVYRTLDVISPWMVGCCMNIHEVDLIRDNVMIPSMAEAEAHGIDFMPVIFPGFSWANLASSRPGEFERTYPYNEFPRNGGQFYWRQVYNAISSGAEMLLVAMFDEIDEGTAMFKLAETESDFPEEVTLVPLNADGYNLPSDFYLLLGGETGKALRGEIPLSLELPLATDLDIDQQLIELGGTWEGTTSGGFLITFVLESVCSLDQICGTVEIPDFSYKGEVTFIEIKGNEYVFQVIELATGKPGNPYESLTLFEDGTLRYYTTDYLVQNEGVLVKK